VQFAKALPPSLVTDAGISTLFNAIQHKKAFSPISIIPSGNVTDFILVPEQTSSPILVTHLGIFTFSMIPGIATRVSSPSIKTDFSNVWAICLLIVLLPTPAGPVIIYNFLITFLLLLEQDYDLFFSHLIVTNLALNDYFLCNFFH
jgi:hypothetical protein